MVFHWSLSNSNSLHVSRILLNILDDLINAAVWMVSILPLIFNSSSLFSKPFDTIPRASSTIGIALTFIFRSFLCSPSSFKYLSISFRFLLFSFCSPPERQIHKTANYLFILFHFISFYFIYFCVN